MLQQQGGNKANKKTVNYKGRRTTKVSKTRESKPSKYKQQNKATSPSCWGLGHNSGEARTSPSCTIYPTCSSLLKVASCHHYTESDDLEATKYTAG